MTKYIAFVLVTLIGGKALAASRVTGAHFAEGRVLKITEVCKDIPNCKSRGRVNVAMEFALGGCLDDFGGATHVYDTESQKLYVVGVSLENSESDRVRCKRQPTQGYEASFYGPIDHADVVFLTEERSLEAPINRHLSGAGLAPGRVISITKSKGTSRVALSFDLGACGNFFGGATSHYDSESKKLYVAGIALRDRSRTPKKCIRQPTQSYVIDVKGGSPNLDVVFLSKVRP